MKSGVFFKEQTPLSLKQAIEEFEKKKFNPDIIRKQAEKFSKEKFERAILELIEKN